MKIIKTKNRLVFFILGFLLTSSGMSAFAQNEAAVWLTHIFPGSAGLIHVSQTWKFLSEFPVPASIPGF